MIKLYEDKRFYYNSDNVHIFTVTMPSAAANKQIILQFNEQCKFEWIDQRRVIAGPYEHIFSLNYDENMLGTPGTPDMQGYLEEIWFFEEAAWYDEENANDYDYDYVEVEMNDEDIDKSIMRRFLSTKINKHCVLRRFPSPKVSTSVITRVYHSGHGITRTKKWKIGGKSFYMVINEFPSLDGVKKKYSHYEFPTSLSSVFYDAIRKNRRRNVLLGYKKAFLNVPTMCPHATSSTTPICTICATEKQPQCLITLALENSVICAQNQVDKCRCNRARVLTIERLKDNGYELLLDEQGETVKYWNAVSMYYDTSFQYSLGAEIFIPNFEDSDRQCAAGIHFYFDKGKALNHQTPCPLTRFLNATKSATPIPISVPIPDPIPATVPVQVPDQVPATTSVSNYDSCDSSTNKEIESINDESFPPIPLMDPSLDERFPPIPLMDPSLDDMLTIDDFAEIDDESTPLLQNSSKKGKRVALFS